jgi:peroxiredoxin
VKRKNLLWAGAGLAMGAGLGILILFGLGGWGRLAGQANPDPAKFGVGSQAPDFELETVTGEWVRLNDLRGRVVLLNFWATWCAPCKEEMPLLQDRYERYAPDLRVLAIDFAEPAEDVREFSEQYGLTFEILLDTRAFVQEMYRVRGYPTTYLVDAQGVIRAQHIGVMSEKQLDEYLEEAGLPASAGQKSRSW